MVKQDLRQEFDRILEKKISTPGVKAGSISRKQHQLLDAIIRVLSLETTSIPAMPDEGPDDFGEEKH